MQTTINPTTHHTTQLDQLVQNACTYNLNYCIIYRGAYLSEDSLLGKFILLLLLAKDGVVVWCVSAVL